LRGGLRGDAEVFETEGNPIAGQPVTGTIFSAGFGVNLAGIRVNVAYENSNLKYEDIWASAVNKNRDRRYAIVADLSYQLPLLR
jgi:hypothetical protein